MELWGERHQDVAEPGVITRQYGSQVEPDRISGNPGDDGRGLLPEQGGYVFGVGMCVGERP